MESTECSQSQPSSSMGKVRSRNSVLLADGFLFAGGAISALLLIWGFNSFLTTIPKLDLSDKSSRSDPSGLSGYDPKDTTFYDDPKLSYSIEDSIENWDEKRREWIDRHPHLAYLSDKVLMVTGSQPSPCRNPVGDHLLLRFFKNKLDYCRLHGYELFYNNALLHPMMGSFWAKLPVIRAAMVAHPEAEWIWWVDADAAFTDMEFKLPLERYKNHHMVVHGWANLVFKSRSWTGLNAGVFLIRNSQWAMDLIRVWAEMGPLSPDYERWGRIQKSIMADKLFPGSDDQAALIYLLLDPNGKWSDKIYLEGEYYFQGYWVDIVGTLDNTTVMYEHIERRVRGLRRRRAEAMAERTTSLRERYLRGAGFGRGSWRRPFITHFTGCQPCSGDHNEMYSADSCWIGIERALNFADNQVLRSYGYFKPDLQNSSFVSTLPFNFPANS